MINASQTALSLPALQAGDPIELTRMVDTYSAPVYRLALKMLGDTQDAEDVLQETFLKAMRGLKTFEGRSSLSTWLYRIAANEALMKIRKRSTTVVSIDEEPSDLEEEQMPVQIVDWNLLPEDELLSGETRQHLDAAINKLSPALRVVFLLRDVEGLSIKDTMEALNLTETTVKTRLLRARLSLRENLSAYFSERLGKQ